MPHNRYDNFNNFGQGQGGGQGFLPMGGGRGAEMMQAGGGGNPFTGLGGTFGLSGGMQGSGQLTPEEIALLMQMGGGGGGGQLPNYNPALAGPTGVPGIDASGVGIDPAGMAPGGAAGMDFGTGAIDQGVGAIGDAALMQLMERRRLEQMMAMGGGNLGGGIDFGGGTATGMQWGGGQTVR